MCLEANKYWLKETNRKPLPPPPTLTEKLRTASHHEYYYYYKRCWEAKTVSN